PARACLPPVGWRAVVDRELVRTFAGAVPALRIRVREFSRRLHGEAQFDCATIAHEHRAHSTGRRIRAAVSVASGISRLLHLARFTRPVRRGDGYLNSG